MGRANLPLVVLGASLLILGMLIVGASRSESAEAGAGSAKETIFDPDPAHPWNRLHQVFYVRDVGNGQTYVHDGPDAPFGYRGKFLLEGLSHAKAIETLDSFLRAKDDTRIQDPVKRALLQRDLWYVFDRLSEFPLQFDAGLPQRRAVQKRLAQVMHRLEQPAERLLALPDNYALTIKKGAFPRQYDASHPSRPYLPDDLRLDGKGDWVLIGPATSNGYGISVPQHVAFAGGRSVFVSLLRLPGGRKPTEDYIARMPRPTDERMDFAPLPDGSQVALVRRMLLVDDKGELQATPVTESVQVRIFPGGREQRFFEFTLDRASLASGGGGLRATGPGDRELFGFNMLENQVDPFSFAAAGTAPTIPKPHSVLSSCIGCHHQGEKLFTINTFDAGSKTRYRGAAQTELAVQVERSRW